MQMRTRVSAFLLLFWVALAHCMMAVGQQRSENDSCKTALPPEARSVVDVKLRSWKIVTLADLRHDDQRIWTEKFGSTCPGVAAGHFDPSPSSYAVTLIQHRDRNLYQMLAVLKRVGGIYRLSTLSPAAQTDVISIVAKLPPGKYSDPEESVHIESKFDVISYEVIESGAEMYYWQNGHYRSLLTSE